MNVHRVTFLGLRIAKIFVESPRAKKHGYAITKEIGVRERLVYYTLESLENVGWLASRWESQDAVSRPARKLYEITEQGLREGTEAISALQLKTPEAGPGVLASTAK